MPERAVSSPRFVPLVRERGLRVSLRAAPGSTIPEVEHLSSHLRVGPRRCAQVGAPMVCIRSQHVVNAPL